MRLDALDRQRYGGAVGPLDVDRRHLAEPGSHQRELELPTPEPKRLGRRQRRHGIRDAVAARFVATFLDGEGGVEHLAQLVGRLLRKEPDETRDRRNPVRIDVSGICAGAEEASPDDEVEQQRKRASDQHSEDVPPDPTAGEQAVPDVVRERHRSVHIAAERAREDNQRQKRGLGGGLPLPAQPRDRLLAGPGFGGFLNRRPERDHQGEHCCAEQQQNDSKHRPPERSDEPGLRLGARPILPRVDVFSVGHHNLLRLRHRTSGIDRAQRRPRCWRR